MATKFLDFWHATMKLIDFFYLKQKYKAPWEID